MSNNEANMQIFTIITQIEDLLQSSPRPKKLGGSTDNKRLIDVDAMLDLLGDLKVTIPEDIRRANSVIVNAQNTIESAEEHSKELVESSQRQAEATVAQANLKAERVLERAKAEFERLVSEDEIYTEAQNRAKLLALKAEANATLVYESAKNYADDVLADLESFLGEYKQLVAINREDLGARSVNPVIETEQPVAQAQPSRDEERQPARAPKHRGAAEQVIEETSDDYGDFDDDEDYEEGGIGSFFGNLFKRKKKDEIDFDEE